MSQPTYDSNHGATRKITAAAKLAEVACERIAERAGSSLPARFWQCEAWAKPFKQQMIFANSLLKIFDAEAIMAAFQRRSHVLSLNAPFLVDDIKAEAARLKAEQQRAREAPAPTITSTTERPRGGSFARDSLRARLNRIDGKGKGKDKPEKR